MKALKGAMFRYHPRPGALRRARQRGRQHLHSQGQKKDDATSMRWSRPSDVSQSGPTTGRVLKTQSIRATIRRRRPEQ